MTVWVADETRAVEGFLSVQWEDVKEISKSISCMVQAYFRAWLRVAAANSSRVVYPRSWRPIPSRKPLVS